MSVPGQKYVNVYEMDSYYGGAEEGGWYYDTGDPVDTTPVRTPAEIAQVVAAKKLEYPEAPAESCRSYTSVVYQGGDYRVRVEPHRGRHFPETTPQWS